MSRSLLALGFVCLVASTVAAQDWATSNLSRHRVDLRDLGYPMVNEIPANSSAVTSLWTAADGKIYGGTSGQTAYLFVFDPATNKVRHLGRVAGQEAIHHAIVEDAAGDIYFGTGRNMLEPLALSPGSPGSGHIDELLWRDIQNHFRDDPGGHLFRYRPKQAGGKVKLPDMPCEAEDLGIPVPHNAIYALAVSHRDGQIYGLSYPDGHFFVYDLAARKSTDLGEVDREKVFHGPERDWRSLPRAVIARNDGASSKVITSGTGGAIVYHVPGSGKLVTTDLKVPGDYDHVQFFGDHAVIECMAQAPSGLIYGGTCDGYFFSLDARRMKLVNLGKPRAARRLRALTIGPDRSVYLAAGERSASKPCQLYRYDPRGGFEDLGLVIVDRSPYYYARGCQFDAMATGRDGTIYLGESERRSHLFLLFP